PSRAASDAPHTARRRKRARGLNMDCGKARELNLNGLRGRLSSELAAELREHLSTCAPCREHAEAERVLSEILETQLLQHAAPLALKRRLAASWSASTSAAPPPRRPPARAAGPRAA